MNLAMKLYHKAPYKFDLTSNKEKIENQYLKPIIIDFFEIKDDELIKVGYIDGYYFKKSNILKYEAVALEEFLEQGETFPELFKSIIKYQNILDEYIAYINYFEIFDAYKNKGIGSKILEIINLAFTNQLNITLTNAILIPDPFKEDNESLKNIYLDKLKGFYSRAGFRLLSDEFGFLFLMKKYNRL